MSLISELNRRNVFRVDTAYIIVGWIIMQVIDVMSPALQLPDWVASLFAVILLIGFPIAVAISWIYEVTEDGLKKTANIDGTQSITGETGRRLDSLIIVGLIAVGGLIIWQQITRETSSVATAAADQDGVDAPMQEAPAASGEPPSPAAELTQSISANSIAVLPFAELSAEREQEYFADGVSEEILNVLAGVRELKVAGRTSSFSFKGRNEDLRKIGNILGVAHILEGSVRKQGNRVRVTAQLIKADDGFHLWSETYDNDLDDIFAVQDEIAGNILQALTAELVDRDIGSASAVARADVRAFDAFLEAKELIYSRDTDAMRRAIDLLDNAIAIDPDYAPPYAQRALAESLLSDAPGSYGDTPISEALPRAIAFADKALALNPELADAQAIRGLLYLDTGQLEQAIGSLRRAVDINPNHLDARNWLALSLSSNGRYRDAAQQQVALFEFDPLYPPITGNVITQLLRIGDVDRASQVIRRMERFEGNESRYTWAQSILLGATGQVARAIQLSEPEHEKYPDTNRGSGLAFARLGIGDIEGAREYGYYFVDIYADIAAGDYENAVAGAKRALDDNPEYYATQIDYIVALAAADKHRELVGYYRETYGDDLIFENRLFQPFNADLPPFGSVARSLRAVGDVEDYEAIMRRWRTALDIGRAGGADSFTFNFSEVVWHALNGNPDRAVEFLTRISDRRSGLIGFFANNPFLDELLGDHPGFRNLQELNLQRINQERRKLGLDSIAF